MTNPGGDPVSPSTSPTSIATRAATLTDQQLHALDTALAAEQAAVYAYGVVGAQSSKTGRAAALVALQGHALQRDLLAGRLSAAGRPAPAGAAAYVLPVPVRSPASARALAAHVERTLCAVYADLVAATEPGGRSEAARWLTDSVLAAHHWGATPQTFPGLPERGAVRTDPSASPQPRSTS